ncbi:MAG: hypothetical protein JWN70_5437 [Planctomycetaceae bacterium]|nr:hypothetical protein [Planctomycetaceae bacterium]
MNPSPGYREYAQPRANSCHPSRGEDQFILTSDAAALRCTTVSCGHSPRWVFPAYFSNHRGVIGRRSRIHLALMRDLSALFEFFVHRTNGQGQTPPIFLDPRFATNFHNRVKISLFEASQTLDFHQCDNSLAVREKSESPVRPRTGNRFRQFLPDAGSLLTITL